MLANDTVGKQISSIIDMSLYSNNVAIDGKYNVVGTFHAGTISEVASAQFEDGHVWFSVDGGYLQYHDGVYTIDGQSLIIDMGGSQDAQAAIDNRGVVGDLAATVKSIIPDGITDWFSNLEDAAKKCVIAAGCALGLFLIYKLFKSKK